MPRLEQQVKDWKAIKGMIADSRKMFQTEGRQFLRNEVYPAIREYVVKYKTKYDVLNEPK